MPTPARLEENAAEPSQLLRLPAEIRHMILAPLLIADETLQCPSRVYGNPLVSWKAFHGVHADMMFTCWMLYYEVLNILLSENDFLFSVPPTTTAFSCANYARRARSITFQVNSVHWEEWQTYLSESNPLVVKNLNINIVHPPVRNYLEEVDKSLRSIGVCESLVENIVITGKVDVHMASYRHQFIRGKCLSSFPLANQVLISVIDLQNCLLKAMVPSTKDKGPLLALKTRIEAQESSN
jgi:hypothetical protein